jgi:hypothetical protein
MLKQKILNSTAGEFALEQFMDFLMQISYKSFPIGNNMVEGERLDRLINFFEEQFRKRSENTLLFEDIDKVFYEQSEKVRSLTDQLRKDSSISLPPDYRMHISKNISYVNRMAGKIKISEPHIISYEIISELLGKIIGIHLIEPVLVIENKLAVRPNVFNGLIRSPVKTEQNQPQDEASPDRAKQPRNKFRTILDASRVEHNKKSSIGSSPENIRSPVYSKMISSPNANAETIGSLISQQKDYKQNLVELNRKRLEKLANRRKIIENEMKINTMPT